MKKKLFRGSCVCKGSNNKLLMMVRQHVVFTQMSLPNDAHFSFRREGICKAKHERTGNIKGAFYLWLRIMVIITK